MTQPHEAPGRQQEAPARPVRELRWPQFLVVVVIYVAIIQGVGLLIGVDTHDAKSPFPTAEALLRNALIPIGLSVAYGIAVVTWLGWWGEVLHDRQPVQRWVRFVPISMIVIALIGINVSHLADQTVALVGGLIVLGIFVGVGEELMFRGVGVVSFRRGGFSEGKVALWSSLVFGLVHVSNAISAGPRALVQAAVVSTSGYFFYLARRSGGTILLAMLAHGLWDFSLFSSLAGSEPKAYFGMFLVILLQLGLIVLLIVRRRRIELADATTPAAG